MGVPGAVAGHQPKSTRKKRGCLAPIAIIVCLATTAFLGLGIYTGYQSFEAYRLSPEGVVEAFLADVQEGDDNDARNLLCEPDGNHLSKASSVILGPTGKSGGQILDVRWSILRVSRHGTSRADVTANIEIVSQTQDQRRTDKRTLKFSTEKKSIAWRVCDVE